MARNNMYPPSVKPGIPNLGEKPNGWIEISFGDIFEIIERPANLQDEKPYQLITARRNRGGIVARDKLLGREVKTKTQFFVHPDDFVISRRQIVHGACGIVPEELNGAIVSNEYLVILPKTDYLLLSYLAYLSHTIFFQQSCFQASVGVDIEKMVFRVSEWLKQRVYLPPMREQRKIARILGTWDEAIAATEQLIQALQRRKKGLMQRLLTGQVRFPEFQEQEWRQVHLSDVATVIMGQSPSSSNYNEDEIGLPLVQGNADIKDRRTHPRVYSTQITKTCEINDVILSVRAPVGETALATHNAVIGRGVCAIRAKKIDSLLLYYLLMEQEPKWDRYAQGSTFKAINSGDIRSFKVSIPKSHAEQKAIAEVLETADNEIELLMQQRDALKRQKKGLMQRLLTGQVRVYPNKE